MKNTFCLSRLKSFASAALAAAVFALASPAAAQTSGVMSADQLSSLTAMANEHGNVRVIVELATSGIDAGMSVDQVNAQRAAIASAQAGMASAFGDDAVNRTYANVPMVAMTLTAAQLQALQSMSDVVAVHLDGLSAPTLNRSTRLTRARTLWNNNITGDGTTVAVLDTGIAYNNRAFRPVRDRIATSACFSSSYSADGSRSACRQGRTTHIARWAAPARSLSIGGAGHGTHVAGTVAAIQPNWLRGMAHGATLIPIQVFSIFDYDSGYCDYVNDCMLSYTGDQIAALDQVLSWVMAGTYPIASVNMSLGGGYYTSHCSSDPRATVISNLRAYGVAVVISSGNNGYTDAVGGPACVEDAVAVGATDDNDVVAYFSNQAPGLVDVMAPGVEIRAAYPGTRNRTTNLQGTSMAAPHVAGAFALLRQRFPSATVDQMETALNCTGVEVSRDGNSYYRINVARARANLAGWAWGNPPRAPRCP